MACFQRRETRSHGRFSDARGRAFGASATGKGQLGSTAGPPDRRPSVQIGFGSFFKGDVMHRFRNLRARTWEGLLFQLAGLAALIWFLLRVIEKPSRAFYPCQRAAFPIASAFVVSLVS